ncbi:MAG: ABC transporter permease [Acidimicrobiia bacterium]|nr:ABC transporter permease [Acidimicrobiia bacterium]
MRAALVVASKDLRQRLRDRSAFVVGIVAPLVLATLISLALGQVEEDFGATLAVVDQDGGPLARALVDDVLGGEDLREVLEIRTVATPQEAADLADDGDVAAAIVIPAGFSAVAEGGDPVPLRVVRSAEKPIGADVAEAIATGFTAQVDAVRLAVRTAADVGGVSDPAAIGLLAERAAAEPPPVALAETGTAEVDVPPASQFAPGMGILFLFFTVGLGARSILAERREGTLARLLAAPITGRSLLVGKAAATFVLGVTSLATLAVVSTLLIDARWGDPVSAAVLIVAIVLAAMGVVALVLTFARTEQQASGYASIAAFGLALLGGNFIQLEQAPELLRRLSLLTPNGWALRAFGDLAAEGGGLASVLPEVGAVLAFAAATLGVALARSGRLVRL